MTYIAFFIQQKKQISLYFITDKSYFVQNKYEMCKNRQIKRNIKI